MSTKTDAEAGGAGGEDFFFSVSVRGCYSNLLALLALPAQKFKN